MKLNSITVYTTTITLALAFGLGTTSAHAIDPDAKCEFSKLKEAGKYGFCRLKAESKGVKKSAAPDYSKCETKFSTKWGKAEDKAGTGVCPSEVDETDIEGRSR